MKSLTIHTILGLLCLALPAFGQSPKYATEIPASVTTPDSVVTRLGTLEFSPW